ncbi:MAG: hypothetical protein JWM63_1190 [Gammaproteobacteria bacterium]|jgi:uncharacterized coiled-coil protein SlyX|nr:hypothetical protein [Gammaproteobacteria bacterium]
MPVPWVHIVRLMPSILEVSRELLKRSRRPPPAEPPAPVESVPATAAFEGRISTLEENERRQAELVTSMAEQLAQLTTAVTALHERTRRLLLGQVATAVVAVVALVLVLR